MRTPAWSPPSAAVWTASRSRSSLPRREHASAPLERLATELNERFRVLTGGDRGALARHQTLLASVDWSHDLLSDKERKLFRRLCVFVATFGGDAVAAVVTDDELDEYEALDLLGRLVDKSLVQLDDASGRYHLLETMRQLALDRCRAADELDQLRDRHLRWVLGFLEGVDHDLCDRPTMAAMDADYLNIRAALSWAADRDNDAAVRLVDTLGGYWGLSGRHRDTFLFSKPILDGARDRDPVRWATAVSMVAWVFVSAGDTQFVTNDVVAALERARSEGDVASQARCLYGIGLASPGQSEMFEPVHELATEAGNQRYAAYGALLATGSLIGTAAGDPAFERAGRVAVGFDDETFELAYPGWMAQHLAWRGHPSRAVALAREALQHESRAIAAVFTVAAGAMSIALQVGDASLLRLAAESIPSELRQIPGAEWWVQLLDDGAQLLDPDRVPSAIDPPPVLMLFLLASDLVLRLLLTDGRLDDADSWAAQVPPTWPAAHGSARLAQAWTALQRGDREAGDRIHQRARGGGRTGHPTLRRGGPRTGRTPPQRRRSSRAGRPTPGRGRDGPRRSREHVAVPVSGAGRQGRAAATRRRPRRGRSRGGRQRWRPNPCRRRRRPRPPHARSPSTRHPRLGGPHADRAQRGARRRRRAHEHTGRRAPLRRAQHREDPSRADLRQARHQWPRRRWRRSSPVTRVCPGSDGRERDASAVGRMLLRRRAGVTSRYSRRCPASSAGPARSSTACAEPAPSRYEEGTRRANEASWRRPGSCDRNPRRHPTSQGPGGRRSQLVSPGW